MAMLIKAVGFILAILDRIDHATNQEVAIGAFIFGLALIVFFTTSEGIDETWER